MAKITLVDMQGADVRTIDVPDDVSLPFCVRVGGKVYARMHIGSVRYREVDCYDATPPSERAPW